MLSAAEQLDFERAAKLRDQIVQAKQRFGEPVPEAEEDRPGFARRGGRRRGKKGGSGKRVPWPEKP